MAEEVEVGVLELDEVEEALVDEGEDEEVVGVVEGGWLWSAFMRQQAMEPPTLSHWPHV